MLSKHILLGALGLIPMSLAVPHSFPARIDLNHRVAPNMKLRHTVETLSEANVSQPQCRLFKNLEDSRTYSYSGSEVSMLEIPET